MTAKVRVASTAQTAKGVEYIAASAPDTHHEAIIDLGKNREPGWLRSDFPSCAIEQLLLGILHERQISCAIVQCPPDRKAGYAH